MKRISGLTLILAALALTACGSSSSSSPSASSSPSSSTGAAVTMQNIAFSPTTLQAKVGATVKWTNQDQVAHNVTYVGGPKFTSSPTFSSGGTYSIKLTQAGTIQYRCTLHAGMNATIVVSQ